MGKRKEKATAPSPLTAPVIHYEGRKLRRLLLALIAIDALRLIVELT